MHKYFPARLSKLENNYQCEWSVVVLMTYNSLAIGQNCTLLGDFFLQRHEVSVWLLGFGSESIKPCQTLPNTQQNFPGLETVYADYLLFNHDHSHLTLRRVIRFSSPVTIRFSNEPVLLWFTAENSVHEVFFWLYRTTLCLQPFSSGSKLCVFFSFNI